ncbi:MAG: YggT family protein [Spirochaetaceae bacterium]
MLQDIMRLISTAISIYMLIIFVRIVMTWVQGASYGRAMQVISSITDPYLNLFRGMRFLQVGYVDFSPIAAIITLSIVSNITTQIAYAGTVTVGRVLAFTLSAVGSAVFFFVTLFLIITTVRVVAVWIGVNSTGRFWITLDRLLQPLTFRLLEKFGRSESLTYPQALMAFAATLLVVLILGRFLLSIAVGALAQLPF